MDGGLHSDSGGQPEDLEERLSPGAGRALYEVVCSQSGSHTPRRVLQLLSRMSSAMRARDSDQSRSAVRSETDSDSAVSAMVKPAK